MILPGVPGVHTILHTWATDELSVNRIWLIPSSAPIRVLHHLVAIRDEQPEFRDEQPQDDVMDRTIDTPGPQEARRFKR